MWDRRYNFKIKTVFALVASAASISYGITSCIDHRDADQRVSVARSVEYRKGVSAGITLERNAQTIRQRMTDEVFEEWFFQPITAPSISKHEKSRNLPSKADE